MTLGQRVTGVLLLEPTTFEEIEADTTATRQALVVVIVASIAAGIGAGLLFGPLALVRETLAALIGWVMWAGVTYLLGARLLPEPDTKTDMGELLRGIVACWLLATMVIAVRQALDYRSTTRAAVVVFIGWLVFVVIVAVL